MLSAVRDHAVCMREWSGAWIGDGVDWLCDVCSLIALAAEFVALSGVVHAHVGVAASRRMLCRDHSQAVCCAVAACCGGNVGASLTC